MLYNLLGNDVLHQDATDIYVLHQDAYRYAKHNDTAYRCAVYMCCIKIHIDAMHQDSYRCYASRFISMLCLV